MSKRILALLLISHLVATSDAQAEMGKGAVLDGVYISLDAAFAREQANRTRAFGTEEPHPPFSIEDKYLEFGDGWSPGGTLGYADPRGILGIFDRAEITVNYTKFIGQSSERKAYTFLSAVNALDFAFYADNVSSEIEAVILAGSVPFKYDVALGGENSLTLSFEPFVRGSQQELRTLLKSSGASPDDPVSTYAGSADLSELAYGAMFAVEPELQLTDFVSIACRAGGGVYAYNSRGTFYSQFLYPGDAETSNAQVSDELTDIGWRTTVGAAIKVRLAPSAILSSYIAADYWSKAGSIEMPTNDFYALESQAASIGATDVWDFRTGVRLTVGIGK